MKRKPITFTLIGLGALLAVAAIAGPPSLPTLNPPAPSYYTCGPTGSGAICRGQTVETIDAEPSGIVCGTAQNPVWDELRNDRRFRELVVEMAKPVSL